MIKDTQQKLKAVRYCVARGYVPHLEVVVRYGGDIAERPSDITDVDVLGILPAGAQPTRRVVFDCKTQQKISPVARALWAAGLRQLVHADEGFVILSKAAPEGHRLAANSLGIRLLSEKLFDQYAMASSGDYLEGLTYLDESTAWDELFELASRSKGLAPLVSYLTCDAPLERNAAIGFRALLGKLRMAEGEFDVSKPAHRLLYGAMVSQAQAFLSEMTNEFRVVFDPFMGKEEFDLALRNYVWGGREGFELRQRLHVAIAASKGIEEQSTFQLPSWERLLELMRALLDAPLLAGSAALPLKDLAFKEVSPAAKPLADKRIALALTSNNRARQFALQTNRYLGSLSRLLRECSEHYTKVLGSI